jgi:hypothetical protein
MKKPAFLAGFFMPLINQLCVPFNIVHFLNNHIKTTAKKIIIPVEI